MKKKLTIRDIAKRANVSHTTVSRVLNEGQNVSQETRERVLSVVRALNFSPNPRAKAFSSNRSRLIGLLLNDISNPFFAELARGMEDSAYENGYYVIICSTDKLHKRKDYLDFLMKAGIDGLAFASVKLTDHKIRELIQEAFPLVMVNQKLKGEDFGHVVCDNRKGVKLLINHLVGLGYSKLAIACGPSEIYTGRERLDGYYQALKDNSISINQEYIFQDTFSFETGYKGTKEFLKLENKPEAIVACNNNIARGVLEAIHDQGLRVPEDIAVVGFDNTDFAAHGRVKLTTIDQKKYLMGSLTAEMLIKLIEQGSADHVHRVLIEPELIVRESCGATIR